MSESLYPATTKALADQRKTLAPQCGVRLRWRLLMTGYLVFVLGVIALAYGLAI